MPSVLWCCWLGGRKGNWPVKNWVVGCWHGYLSGARCRPAYGPADAIATHCLLLQIGFIFLVPSHPVSPGQRAVKRVYVLCFLQVNLGQPVCLWSWKRALGISGTVFSIWYSSCHSTVVSIYLHHWWPSTRQLQTVCCVNWAATLIFFLWSFGYSDNEPRHQRLSIDRFAGGLQVCV